MTGPIEPTVDDLAAAYSSAGTASGENGPAGWQSASAVVVGARGICVLSTSSSSARGEESSVLRLTPGGDVEWTCSVRRIAGRALAELPGTGWVVVGETRYDTLAYRAVIVVLNESGEQIAARSMGEPGATTFFAVLVRADGTIVAAGTDGGQGRVVCLDRSLRVLWTYLVPGSEQARCLAAPRGTDVVVAGRRTSTSGLGTSQLAALDPHGVERWRLDLPLHGGGEITTVLPVDDGLLAVGDISSGARDGVRLWVLKIGLDRATNWEQQEDFPGSSHRTRRAAMLPDGSIAVIADAASGAGRDVLLWRLTDDGRVTARHRFASGSYDTARDLAALDREDVVVVGSTSSPDDDSAGALVMRLDADGHARWRRTFPHL